MQWSKNLVACRRSIYLALETSHYSWISNGALKLLSDGMNCVLSAYPLAQLLRYPVSGRLARLTRSKPMSFMRQV